MVFFRALRALIFIAYVNDIMFHILNAKLTMYGDNITFLFTGPSINLQAVIYNTLSELQSWMSETNLLNASK